MSSLVLHLPRSLVPMSREEYERKHITIRRVVDPETGRSRLIRGEGEVLEEIVSRDRHKEINKASACMNRSLSHIVTLYTSAYWMGRML